MSAARDSGRLYRLLAGLFFLGLSFAYYLPSLSWLPRGIHEWAQADRLALAISFYDHGLNFLRPQTLNISSTDGIVGVEFPLLAYLAALGAKVLGRGAVIPLYRALTAAVAWLGYYYLFRLVFDRTRQFVVALLPGVFLAASPVYAYYAGSFLPDPASAALVLVATYYLLRYQATRRSADLAGALVIFTLATLLKLSAGIYLVAALGSLLLWGYLQPTAQSLRQRWLLLGLAGAALGAVAGYTLYNRYLNATYQSWVFMASPKPIETMAQFHEVLRLVRRDWQGEYFAPFQYRLLWASGVLCVLSLGRLLRTEWLWAAQLVLAALGGVAFVRLLGAQLTIHDYYVLAPCWPALVLLVALAATLFAQRLAAAPALLQLLFGAALLALLVPGWQHFRARMSDPYPPFSDYYAYRWMQGGAAQLAAAHVPASANILVLGEGAPNLSLIYFDRRGLVWHSDMTNLPLQDIGRQMTDAGLDYLVMSQATFHYFQPAHPDLLTDFSPLLTTPQYVVFHYRHAVQHW